MCPPPDREESKKLAVQNTIILQFLEMLLEVWMFSQDTIRAIKKDLFEAPRPSHPLYHY